MAIKEHFAEKEKEREFKKDFFGLYKKAIIIHKKSRAYQQHKKGKYYKDNFENREKVKEREYYEKMQRLKELKRDHFNLYRKVIIEYKKSDLYLARKKIVKKEFVALYKKAIILYRQSYAYRQRQKRSEK